MNQLNPILFIAVPLFAAFSIPLLTMVHKRMGYWVLTGTLLFNLAGTLSLFPRAMANPIIVIIAGYRPPFGINLMVGPFGIFMATLISAIGVLVSIYLLKETPDAPADKFPMLVLLIVMGATGIVLTGDIFNLFVFTEIMSIAAYALTAVQRDAAGSEAGMKYLLAGSLSSTFLLVGIALIYNQLGTLNLADIASHFGDMNPVVGTGAMIFLFLGFGIEAEMFPLNGWAPDVYTGAPAPVAALFAGVTVKAALYVMVRFLFTVAGAASWIHLLLWFGAATVIVSELAALKQTDVRRMLAYSSLGQVGVILVAVGIGTQAALTGATFHFVNYAILKAALFLVVGFLATRTGDSSLHGLTGVGRRYPLAAGMFTLAALGVMGFPPLNGFMSKIMILSALADTGGYVLIALILTTSVVEGVYYFRAIQLLYAREGKAPSHDKSGSVAVYLPLLVLGVAIIGLGLFPGVLTPWLKTVAADILGRADYIHAVVAAAGGAM